MPSRTLTADEIRVIARSLASMLDALVEQPELYVADDRDREDMATLMLMSHLFDKLMGHAYLLALVVQPDEPVPDDWIEVSPGYFLPRLM